MSGLVFFLVYIVIPLAILSVVSVAVYATVQASRKKRARERFRTMTLSELQAAEPVPRSSYHPETRQFTSMDLFPTKTQAWFEELLERTFKEESGFEQNALVLNQRYAALLDDLKVCLEQTEFANGATPESDDAWVTLSGTSQVAFSLDWMTRVVKVQNKLARESGSALWDPELFAVDRSSEEVGLGSYKHVARTRCTPLGLQHESERVDS